MKKCSKCSNLLDVSNYHKNALSTDGLRPSCKSCDYAVRKQWRDKNRNRIKETTEEYRKRNLKYYSNVSVVNNKKRRHTNPSFMNEHNYRGLISLAIKRNSKNSKATELLGCSIYEYKKYIESKFKKDMSWLNRGSKWEIDHIIPLKEFDCSDYEQAKKAFNFLNTQVLTIEEHKQKTHCRK